MSPAEVRLDLGRADRIGLGEALLCAGKSRAQIEAVLEQAAGCGGLLLTRLGRRRHAGLAARLRERLDYDRRSRTAFFEHSPARLGPARVAIVAAGTSDARPAREAARTLAFHGEAATLILDVGVAGLWRLMERREAIAAHPVVIVVAGMDAALPSVVGGLVAGVVIAVPSSTGYGAARGGETALAACLASCAPGVTVCNIDNGYGAACAALRALRVPAS